MPEQIQFREEDFEPEQITFDPSDFEGYEKEPSLAETAWETIKELPEARGEFLYSIPVLGELARKGSMGAAAVASYLAQQGRGPKTSYYTGMELDQGYEGTGKSLAEIYSEIEQMQARESGEFQERNPILAPAVKFAAGMAVPGIGPAGSGVKAIASRALGEGLLTGADVQLRDGEEAGVEAGREAAALTAGLGSLGKAYRGARDLVGWAGLGVKPSTAKTYKARQQQIKEADIEETGAKVSDIVNTAKVEALEAGQDFRQAKKIAQEAKADFKDEVKKASVSDDLLEGVIGGLKAKRAAISNASTRAFRELERAGGEVNLIGPLSKLNSYKKMLLLDDGSLPLEGSASREAYDKILKYQDFLTERRGKLSPSDAKKVVSWIDDDLDRAWQNISTGGYIDKGDKALMEVRRKFTQQLMKNPSYAKVMSGLREDMDLMSSVEDLLGKKEKNISTNLKQLLSKKDPGKDIEKIMLIGRAGDSENFVANLSRDRNTLRSIGDKKLERQLIEKLPETQDVKMAEAAYKDAKDYLASVKVPGDAQNWVKKMSYGGATKKQKELIDRLNEQIPDTNLRQEIEDIGVQRAFDVGITRGSKNVNLNAISLAGLVGMFRPEDMGTAGPIAAMFGAVMGAVADVAGPKIYQRWLDAEMLGDRKLGKYLPAIKEAMLRGPRAVGVTHMTLMKTDENYRKLMSDDKTKQPTTNVPMPKATEGLMGAAERGDNGVNAAHNVKMQTDPEYRKKVTNQGK